MSFWTIELQVIFATVVAITFQQEILPLETKLIKILSLDGGGVKGIVQASILARIERETNKKICQMFDLIAGTSAGAINALALTKPEPIEASSIVEFYYSKIFNRSLIRSILTGNQLWGAKYSGLKLVEDYLGNSMLSEIPKSEVLIPAFELTTYQPWFFNSWKAKFNPSGVNDFQIKDVAIASASTEIYFPPHLVKTTGRELIFTDGGVFANNPAALAIVEAWRMWPHKLHEPMLVLSIGTGEVKLSGVKKLGWGILQWALPLVHIVRDSALKVTDYYCEMMLNPNLCKYIRLQPKIPPELSRFDETNLKKLNALQVLAEKTLDYGILEEIVKLIN